MKAWQGLPLGEAADLAAGRMASNLDRMVRRAQVPLLVASRTLRPTAEVPLAFDASAQRAVARMAGSSVFQKLSVTMVRAEEPVQNLSARTADARNSHAAGSTPTLSS